MHIGAKQLTNIKGNKDEIRSRGSQTTDTPPPKGAMFCLPQNKNKLSIGSKELGNRHDHFERGI